MAWPYIHSPKDIAHIFVPRLYCFSVVAELFSIRIVKIMSISGVFRNPQKNMLEFKFPKKKYELCDSKLILIWAIEVIQFKIAI